MIGKSLLVGLLTVIFSLNAFSDTESESLVDKLDGLEEIIVETEIETSACQMQNGWHFPVQLYNYVQLARQYGDNLKRSKKSRKFDESLQNLIDAIDECIDGREGYWSGNWSDVWVDPVPSVPDCALGSFKKLKEELEAQIAVLK